METLESVRPTGSAAHARGWWSAVAAYAVVAIAGTVPTPLYVIYQHRYGFGTGMLTVAFAVYVVGVVAALLGTGHLSDHLGRRPLILLALAVQLVACLVFIAAPDLPGLLAGRVISGVSVGIATGAVAAWIAELHAAARPGASSRRADLGTIGANLGGIALGPMLSGVLAQWLPDPLAVPYAVVAGLLLVVLFAVARTPETRQRAAVPRLRPYRPRAPRDGRALFVTAAAGALVAFAVMGLFSALTPSFLSGTLHSGSRAVAGLVTGTALGAGALAQLSLHRISAAAALRIAAGMLPAGLALVVAGVWLTDAVLFTAGGAAAGAGAGLLFKSCLASAGRVVPPGQRAETMALFFTSAFAGLALPVVGLGTAMQLAGALPALAVFTVLCLLALAAVGGRLSRLQAE